MHRPFHLSKTKIETTTLSDGCITFEDRACEMVFNLARDQLSTPLLILYEAIHIVTFQRDRMAFRFSFIPSSKWEAWESENGLALESQRTDTTEITVRGTFTSQKDWLTFYQEVVPLLREVSSAGAAGSTRSIYTGLGTDVGEADKAARQPFLTPPAAPPTFLPPEGEGVEVEHTPTSPGISPIAKENDVASPSQQRRREATSLQRRLAAEAAQQDTYVDPISSLPSVGLQPTPPHWSTSTGKIGTTTKDPAEDVDLSLGALLSNTRYSAGKGASTSRQTAKKAPKKAPAKKQTHGANPPQAPKSKPTANRSRRVSFLPATDDDAAAVPARIAPVQRSPSPAATPTPPQSEHASTPIFNKAHLADIPTPALVGPTPLSNAAPRRARYTPKKHHLATADEELPEDEQSVASVLTTLFKDGLQDEGKLEDFMRHTASFVQRRKAERRAREETEKARYQSTEVYSCVERVFDACHHESKRRRFELEQAWAKRVQGFGDELRAVQNAKLKFETIVAEQFVVLDHRLTAAQNSVNQIGVAMERDLKRLRETESQEAQHAKGVLKSKLRPKPSSDPG